MIFHYRGEFLEDRISLAADGPALRYGFGFFETLYWDGENICRLDAHLARLVGSLREFGLTLAPEPWTEIIAEVARRNGLAGRPARINLTCPVDTPASESPLTAPLSAIVTAAPYSPPAAPLRLALSPRPLCSWLGRHKTCNHLHYHLEHRHALEAGLHGAVLASPDGFLLEATHASLVLARDGELLTPAPPADGDGSGILPGSALATAREVLDITARPVPMDELEDFDRAWALNSLLGMHPVEAIGPHGFTPDFETARAAGAAILAP